MDKIFYSHIDDKAHRHSSTTRACYVENSLSVYDFELDDNAYRVVEPLDTVHDLEIHRLFVVIDCLKEEGQNTELVVWNAEHIPLSDLCSAAYNQIHRMTLLTPSRCIYRHQISIYNIYCNQATVHDDLLSANSNVEIGSILIDDFLSFNDCLQLGVLAAKCTFDDIVRRALSESL